MRLGIFGGTFNPVHLAHLIIAERLREEMDLARVVFIPTAIPPHKKAPGAGADHRLAMVRLAVAGNPFLEASDVETTRGGRTYSVDTLRVLERRRPGAELFFIAGLDAFAEVGTWKEAAALFRLASFVVIPRPGYESADLPGFLPAGMKAAEAVAGIGRPTRRWSVEGGRDIYLIPLPPVGISSSEIRSRVAAGRSIRYMVPPAVEEYIRRENLYREKEVE